MNDTQQSNVKWFQPEAKDGGVFFTFSDDPLDFVWQTPAQAVEIARKITAIIEQLEAQGDE